MAIEYPVSPESRWALYNTATQEILRHNEPWPRRDGGPVEGLDADLVPLLEVRLDKPVYDSATQKLEPAPAVVDVDANTHTHSWDVIALSQTELDAIAARAQHDANRDLAKSIYVDLRDGNGTQLDRLRRVERVAAWLLKETFFDDLAD